MGNNPGKKQCGEGCEKNLEDIFASISCKKNSINRNDLKRAWSSQIDKNLYDQVESYLYKTNPNELNRENFKKLYLNICKGDCDQKVEVFCSLLNGKDVIRGDDLLKFLTSILNSILLIQECKAPKRFNTWSSKTKSIVTQESLNAYGNYFLSRVQKTAEDTFSKEDIRSILTYLDFFLLMILSRMYEAEEKHFYTSLLPKWRYGSVDSGRTLDEISVLDVAQIIFLNLQLPVDFQSEWRILFSTAVHGESFSRLSGEIINKGPTILIIKDKQNHIFGGFAPVSWSLGPNFLGDSRSFLFTLAPAMNLYMATNFNENYQYMNMGQQTMPNGLGMGGKLEYFGLWLNAEFGTGSCSESCTTYRNYKMMSGSKEFEISHLEVWGVGPPPPTAAELGERSVLDGNTEAKAILEMAGKTAYSEGIREEPDQ